MSIDETLTNYLCSSEHCFVSMCYSLHGGSSNVELRIIVFVDPLQCTDVFNTWVYFVISNILCACYTDS